MSEKIEAKARYKRGELVGVTALVPVVLGVPVNLYEDGTYTVRAQGDSVSFDVELLEQRINGSHDEEDLAAAYNSALELDLESSLEQAGDGEADD